MAYRDYEQEYQKVLQTSPWSKDPSSLVKFVGDIQCQSGARPDWREAVEAALQYANSDPEPPTRVMLIGDAPPHNEGKGNPFKDISVHPRCVCVREVLCSGREGGRERGCLYVR